jgi:glycosyltransferase involved in cell wall biosynthesis
MRVLQIHNRYKTSASGEDTVLELERQLLVAHGHRVNQILAANAEVPTQGLLTTLRSSFRALWSWDAYDLVRARIRESSPDVVHVHNTFAALSPSIFWAAKHEGKPVVLTLHNYRLICATSLLLREGNPCEECVGRLPWMAILHRCRYGDSLPIGVVIAATQLLHRLLNTYRKKIDAFIVLSEFAASLMARAGLPANRIFVKPNFVSDTSKEIMPREGRSQALVFVGEVSTIKGIDLLLEAFHSAGLHDQHLAVIGDGPERAALQQTGLGHSGVDWLGKLPRETVLDEMARSRFLVLPSRWYEGLPMVIIEAMSLGTPVIVPDHGPFPTIVSDSRDGLLFRPNDRESLAHVLRKAMRLSPSVWRRYSLAARTTYLENWTPERNYTALCHIYEQAAGKVFDRRKAKDSI